MTLTTLTLTFISTRPIIQSASKLRGFFATRFTEYELLHQHVDAGKLIYRYPKVQYKIIDGTPMVIGINDGAEVLKEIYDQYDQIKLGDNTYEIVERCVTLRKEDFGIIDNIMSYRFVTPWLALNQKNYERYMKSDWIEQRDQLRRTLTGNILSMAKGLDYVVASQILLDIEKVQHKRYIVKGVNMLGVECEFMVNFAIPDYLGLGKSVSRGFGAVVGMRDAKALY
ncbi:MAG: hypothetical protein LAKADJCE_00173 [Candidatus Argoarchaeum ethanivorans]|uniref:DNA repair protein n=1 Tax=Candidatus Argoarchaeum ethanivorans TaxID=2608793 RepID=A0A811TAC3_9EURY|nr:MAG: hypothetical protein LAKADJCE_00173 [Candidatus Argoarchaeum ethanivorans]